MTAKAANSPSISPTETDPQEDTIPQLRPYCFKPGQSGNPRGRPKDPQSLRRARTENRRVLEEMILEYMNKTAEELIAMEQSRKLTATELFVVSIIKRGVLEGDQARMTFLLDRMLGKEPEVTVNTHMHTTDIDEKLKMIPKEKLRALLPKPGEECD